MGKHPAVLLMLLLLLTAAPVRAGELRLVNDRFLIRYGPGDDRIAAELERVSIPIRNRIVADIGADFTERTEVRICGTLEMFRESQPRGTWVPLWAVGTAYPSENLIVLLSPRTVQGGRIRLPEVFAHEFSHVALGRALAGMRAPVWLSEGLAIYEAREWNVSRIAVLTRAALTDRLIPLPVLTLSFPADLEHAELAYAQGFMFVSFLINKVGREPFHNLIRDYTRYGDLEGALRRGTGMTLADLEGRWLDYLKLRVSWIPVVTGVSALWFFAALVFVYGYLRKRRQAKRRILEMEKEEAFD